MYIEGGPLNVQPGYRCARSAWVTSLMLRWAALMQPNLFMGHRDDIMISKNMISVANGRKVGGKYSPIVIMDDKRETQRVTMLPILQSCDLTKDG